MLMKRCPCCSSLSYSAAGSSTWICPVCGADITDVEAQLPGGEDNDN